MADLGWDCDDTSDKSHELWSKNFGTSKQLPVDAENRKWKLAKGDKKNSGKAPSKAIYHTLSLADADGTPLPCLLHAC